MEAEPAYLKRPTKPFQILIQRIPYHPLLLSSYLPHSTHHSSPFLHPEQTLEEFVLARGSLVDPGKHVTNISSRIVCVELDGAGKAVGSAASESVEEGVEG